MIYVLQRPCRPRGRQVPGETMSKQLSLATVVTEHLMIAWSADALQATTASSCWPTMTTMMMMSLCFLALFLTICWIPVITAGCASYQYKAVRATPNGPALCGLSNPAATHEVQSIAVCSSKCSVNDDCNYINYITPQNQQPVCQLYNSLPGNTAVDPQCILFKVRLALSTWRLFILIYRDEKQDAQLSQRSRATLSVVGRFAKSAFKVSQGHLKLRRWVGHSAMSLSCTVSEIFIVE